MKTLRILGPRGPRIAPMTWKVEADARPEGLDPLAFVEVIECNRRVSILI